MNALDKLAKWIEDVQARVHVHDQRLTEIERLLSMEQAETASPYYDEPKKSEPEENWRNR